LASCSGKGVKWEPSLAAAFDRAAKENKMVFVEYFSSTCPHCKKIEPFFSNDTLAKFYNETFINYKLDNEKIKKEDSLFIVSQNLTFESVPFFLFFDKDKNFLHFSAVKPETVSLINVGKTALDANTRTASLKAKYDAGDRTIKTLYAYSALIQLFKDEALINTIADQLYEAYPKNTLGASKGFIIMKNSVKSIENGFFKYWVNHIPEMKGFETGANAGKEIAVLERILRTSLLGNESKTWDLAKINEVKQMILNTKLSDDPNEFTWERESTLLVKENKVNEALAIFNQMMKMQSDNVSYSAYIIDHFITILNDKPKIASLKTWIDGLGKRKLENDEKGYLMYTNILFYKKMQDAKMVKELSTKALDFYKANDINTTKLDSLIADRS
jgi:thiol-disulfide isomerase/thioredoxin